MAMLKSNILAPTTNSRRSTPSHHRKRVAEVTPVRKQISQTLSTSNRISLGKSSSARQSTANSTPSLNHIGISK